MVTLAFEDYPLPPEAFDAVVSATAFHWIDPAVRMVKAADALRIGGALAIASTIQVAGGAQRFFDQVQGCYERFDPNFEPGHRLPDVDEVPHDTAEYDASHRFGTVSFRHYSWEQSYTTKAYLDLLCTDAGHRTMPAGVRDPLFASISALIDGEHGGQVTRRYLTQLAVAHRTH